jgi:hypothetical protein
VADEQQPGDEDPPPKTTVPASLEARGPKRLRTTPMNDRIAMVAGTWTPGKDQRAEASVGVVVVASDLRLGRSPSRSERVA